MDADGVIVEFNPAAERTFGFSREEVLGREVADAIVPERFRDAHRNGLRRFLGTGERTILDQRVELSARHRDGYEFPIEMTISCAYDKGADDIGRPRFHAFLHDISERRLSERVLRAMQSVTHAMARSDTPQEALEALLERLGQDMDWDMGAYWAVAEDGALDRVAGWTGTGVEASEFESGSAVSCAWSRGPGCPGRPWRAVRRSGSGTTPRTPRSCGPRRRVRRACIPRSACR